MPGLTAPVSAPEAPHPVPPAAALVAGPRGAGGDAEADPARDADDTASSVGSSAAFARQMRPWFAVLVVLQIVFLVLRWRLGDVHGALLMFSVCAVGVLALALGGPSGIDAVYGGYFGLMSFVSGLLDLNLAIEHLVWFEWKQWRHEAMAKGDFSGLVKPTVYLVCAFTQLASAFIAYLVYKEAEYLDDLAEGPDETAPFFASAEQARVYTAALRYGERQRSPGNSMGPLKPFAGDSHRLP